MLSDLKTFCLFNPCFVLALGTMALLGSCPQVSPPDLSIDRNRVADMVGWISHPPQLLDDHIYLELSGISVEQQFPSHPYPGRLAVYISSSVRDPAEYFHPPLVFGEILALTTFLEEPQYYATPGATDFRKVARTRGIHHRVRLKSPLQVRRQGHHPAGRDFCSLFSHTPRPFGTSVANTLRLRK